MLPSEDFEISLLSDIFFFFTIQLSLGDSTGISAVILWRNLLELIFLYSADSRAQVWWNVSLWEVISCQAPGRVLLTGGTVTGEGKAHRAYQTHLIRHPCQRDFNLLIREALESEMLSPWSGDVPAPF